MHDEGEPVTDGLCTQTHISVGNRLGLEAGLRAAQLIAWPLPKQAAAWKRAALQMSGGGAHPNPWLET
eukprot:scaffold1618_cov397-Prasinococcus_capsulatus_cf.AAC.6